ncbi:DNA helicase MCM8-like [Amphibalanus amphitrite]|uniref:DNA helicase MCM8-like n=1 Tax=Amphibalanus amphitrite TaxID=1232801 RepID=UPI001C928A79|nr:DNA helicase MCM8-like [Amphibalanus amphitrite]
MTSQAAGAFTPVGYDLYLEGRDDLPVSEVLPRLRALMAFLRAQQYSLDRVAAAGGFPVPYPALAADAGLQQRWHGQLEKAVAGEPELFISLLGLAMYQLLHEEAAETGGATADRLPRVVGRLQGFTPTTKVRAVKAASFGRLVAVKGTVVRVSNVSPHCLSMAFECTACFDVRQHALPGGQYQLPSRCERCNGTQFRPVKSFKTTRTVDRQTFRLQEFSEEDSADSGRVPRSIECELLADLVDACVPGDIVSVCGIVKTFDEPTGKGRNANKNMHLLYIAVNSISNVKAGGSKGTSGIQFTKKDYYAITEVHDRPDTLRLLVQSLCPAIYGHHMVKAGLLLGLFGGTTRPAGGAQELHVRGDPHVLMMGDPGLGKSQLLQACAAVAPRGVYVCGNTSTTSGLTVTLTREKHNDYLLEAGALVLADQGTCCIDEFDKMTAQYQPLLEAMEQQSVSIAKGGIVCTLPARASVLAAANPSGGHYDRERSLADNLKMGAALLSRFDLVFLLLDRPDGALDSLVSSHIMALHASASGRSSSLDTSAAASATPAADWDPEQPLVERLTAAAAEPGAVLPPPLLRKYIAYARKYVHPRLSPEACRTLQDFFLDLRARHQGVDSTPVTTRQLESLIRLTQARARLDLREDATAADAQDVIQLVRFSMGAGGLGGDDAAAEYPVARSRGGKRRGKSGRLKVFLSAVQRNAERLNKTVFTEDELRQVALQAGAGADCFREFLDMANQAGLLLKRGPKLYQVQAD